MDESPRDHDFDQRRDGPEQFPTEHDSQNLHHQHDSRKSRDMGRKSVTIDAPFRHEEKRHSSMPTALNTNTRKSSDIPSPSPLTPHAGRRSTQLTRGGVSAVRQSEEFDRRYDGPYGRPSMTMVRRTSSTPHAVSEAHGVSGGDQEKPSNEATEQTAPQDPSIETLQSSSDPAFEPEPPPLNYTLRTRKLSILFWWTMITFDSTVMPIALYFGLWYGVGPGASDGNRKLSANTVWSIITAALGGASILDYFLRFWRLWKKNSTCRVIGARRLYLDFFHWNFTLGWVIIMLELIIGTVKEYPPIRLVAMPLTSMLWTFGTLLIILDFMRWREMPCPFRISSVPKGAQVRPGIYALIEDICAVDGSGGTDFREALNKRYEASHMFRSMLRRLGLFWSVGAEGMAIVCTILIFTIDGDAAYTVGWSVPFIWAGIWTVATIWYVKKELKLEQAAWAEEVAAKSAA